jgi:hypothetical protein
MLAASGLSASGLIPALSCRLSGGCLLPADSISDDYISDELVAALRPASVMATSAMASSVISSWLSCDQGILTALTQGARDCFCLTNSDGKEFAIVSVSPARGRSTSARFLEQIAGVKYQVGGAGAFISSSSHLLAAVPRRRVYRNRSNGFAWVFGRYACSPSSIPEQI